MRAGDAHCRAALVSSGESPGVQGVRVLVRVLYSCCLTRIQDRRMGNNVAFGSKVIVIGRSCG